MIEMKDDEGVRSHAADGGEAAVVKRPCRFS